MKPPAIENYTAAIRGIAEYASKLSDDSISAAGQDASPERDYLLVMAGEVPRADRAILHQSRSYVRCVLREYRDESARYVANLRQDMAASAGALHDVTRTLAEWDSYGGPQVLDGVSQLQVLTAEVPDGTVAVALQEAAADLQDGLADMRKHYQLIVSQLQTEVRLLHRRMEELTAAESDNLSKLMPREEIEDCIAAAASGTFRLLVLRAGGLDRAKLEQPARVYRELSVAFIRRMRNGLGSDAMVGRWSVEGFVTLLLADPGSAREMAETLRSRLSGPYVCRSEAKTVMIDLETSVEVLETGEGESRKRLIERIDRIL